jgi:hypothetical protein
MTGAGIGWIGGWITYFENKRQNTQGRFEWLLSLPTRIAVIIFAVVKFLY